jgi:hypothetical protein
MPNAKDVVVVIDLTDIAYSSDQDESGGEGTKITGYHLSTDPINPNVNPGSFKISFELANAPGMVASVTNFRYYNPGTNSTEKWGWWGPKGGHNQPASKPMPSGTHNLTNAVYRGEGHEFHWLENNPKALIKDMNDNHKHGHEEKSAPITYHYMVELHIPNDGNGVDRGICVIDPTIKNW